MKQKVIISSEELRNRAIQIVKSLPIDVVHEVVVREHKKDRSAQQNSLYWSWLTIIGNALGESKEAMAKLYKDRFLVQIYERDCPDYAEMIQSLRNVYKKGMQVEAVALRKRIVALTSTTTATVAQMSEYMENISHSAAELAIRLPIPEDL